MDIKEYIEKIIDNGKIEDMHKLSELLEDTMEIIKDYDKECYKDFEMKLYEMAFGKKLTDEIKIEWVKNMRPKAKWELEEIEDIHSQYGVQMPLYSFYVIMNMLYSDMSRGIGQINGQDGLERYIQCSNDWYYDEDANNTEEEKLYAYWKYIVN